LFKRAPIDVLSCREVVMIVLEARPCR
jgi:hypothetical protein